MIVAKKGSFARQLLDWYDAHRRDLPWRARPGARPNPYHVLISEAMLQQTQVVTVIPYFNRFVQKLPTLRDLADADEQTVLRLWQGLGYYSRARNLLKTARAIMAGHDGEVPPGVETLLQLPGVGPYTAGAIASIAFDIRAPIVDGNVARVLCRLFGIQTPPREPHTWKRLWKLAEQILPTKRCGDFNSALMELGATVCTPVSPKCPLCPVAGHCKARGRGLEDRIPVPRPPRPQKRVRRIVLCLCSGSGKNRRWLMEQRPPSGRWAGLWQFITVPASAETPDVTAVTGLKTCPLRQIGKFQHALTHRIYEFEVYVGRVSPKSHIRCGSRRWVRLTDLPQFPLSRPQVRIADLLRMEQ